MTQPANQPDPSSLRNIQKLIRKILPLVDDVADALGVSLLISVITIGWIFIYLYYLQHFSFALALGIAGCALLPCLVLIRVWFALENLKNMPEIIGDLVEDVSESASESWKTVKSGKKGVLNVVGQARKLFQIRSLLGSAGDIFEQYTSIGPLINPFYLFFAVLSLISLFFLLIVGCILAIISLL
jgi:hypothetical protein